MFTPFCILGGHEAPVAVCCFTHDGKYAVTAGHDRTVRLYNPTKIEGGGSVNETNSSKTEVYGVALPPSMASSSSSTSPSLPSALHIKTYSGLHAKEITALHLPPGNNLLVSAGGDKNVIVRDVVSGAMQRRLEGHSARVNCLGGGGGGGLGEFVGRTREPRREWDTFWVLSKFTSMSSRSSFTINSSGIAKPLEPKEDSRGRRPSLEEEKLPSPFSRLVSSLSIAPGNKTTGKTSPVGGVVVVVIVLVVVVVSRGGALLRILSNEASPFAIFSPLTESSAEVPMIVLT